jgi:hypothetical protein
MPSQSSIGKSFEYAVLRALKDELGTAKFVAVRDDSSYRTAMANFEDLPPPVRSEFLRAAKPAVEMLLRLEPRVSNGLSSSDKLSLAIQSDQLGGEGDVRDIVISRPSLNWEIGISSKHQHEAVKHPRLSSAIDFGKKWLDSSCSKEYFAEVEVVFKELAKLKRQNVKWSELQEKSERFYMPILHSFKNELNRISSLDKKATAENLAKFLIGKQDFYKVMKLDGITSVQVFNFCGTLNKAMGRVSSPLKLQRLKLPTRIIELEFRSTESDETTLYLVCDEGWQISFRIHSASTMVEPSLKFDVKLIGKPNSLRTFDFLW